MSECRSSCECVRVTMSESRKLVAEDSYMLHYFNGRGRAELIRLIFTIYGKTYGEHRITEWPGEEKEKAPLGQLPYLEINDFKLPQSIAIARLVAKRANLYGDNDLEQAKTDAVVDTVLDLQTALYESTYHAEDKEAGKKKFISELGPQHLKKLETIVSLYGTPGFSVGSSLKWSDLAVFNVISNVEDVDASLLDAYPNIQAVRKNVESNEKIAEYLKNRPKTDF